MIDNIHLKNLCEYAKCRNLFVEDELNIPSEEDVQLISYETYLSYFEHFYKKSGDEYFGLHFGFFLSFKAMNVIFDISTTVSSLQQLALIWKKYAAVSFPLVNITTLEKPDEFSFIFKVNLPKNLGIQILEAIMAFTYKELRIITGTDLISITIPNKNLEEYKLWFDCPLVQEDTYRIKFHCSPDWIINNKKVRDKIEILLPAFLYYLESLKNEEFSFSHKVKLMTLNLCEPNIPSMEQIASQFCMSSRTLQRMLKEEGTSYRAISNELKKELYLYLKESNDLRTIDKSYILGYSSSSAFLHALKSWNLS